MLGARPTRRTRLALLLAGLAGLAVLALAVPDARDGLMYWGPILALVGLMLVGVRPDALVERLSRRRAPSPARRRAARSLGARRLGEVVLLRSGLLMASSLATRPPPAAPAPAT